MTPNQITMLIILIAYMAVVLAVGLYASRRVKGSEDFLLAGRSIKETGTHISVFCAKK